MRKYWINLFSDTFVWKKGGEALMYNCDCKHTYKYKCANKIEQCTDQLLDPVNLYTIEITDAELIGNKSLSLWVDHMTTNGFGRLTIEDGVNQRPTSLPPFTELQIEENEDPMTYLRRLTIQLGGKSNLTERGFYKQATYPVDAIDMLPVCDIERVLDHLSLEEIDIVGNIFSHPDLFRLADILSRQSAKKNIYVMYKDFVDNSDKTSYFKGAQFEYKLICNVADNLTKLSYHYVFIVTCEAEVEYVEKLRRYLGIRSYDIVPIFTGNNIDYFESKIYIKEDDLHSRRLSVDDLVAHHSINTNFFGRLILLPDGKIYANINHPSIGSIDDPIEKIVSDELDRGLSWRMIRGDAPCSDCVYQFLCPSPSNYELTIGRPNLCHVNEVIV